jgi:hypothetical protein
MTRSSIELPKVVRVRLRRITGRRQACNNARLVRRFIERNVDCRWRTPGGRETSWPGLRSGGAAVCDDSDSAHRHVAV